MTSQLCLGGWNSQRGLNKRIKKAWIASFDGDFCVKMCVQFFGNLIDLRIPWKDIWYTPVPPKIQFFM